MVQHIVMFSGGLGSYETARRVIGEHGSQSVTLLFADTCMEDEDLYRFQKEAVDYLKARLVTIRDGRTPWDVFTDERYLGNSRIDPCSKLLKRRPCDSWLKNNCKPDNTVVYVGIDWTEIHRFERMAPRKLPWVYKAPLCEPPYTDKKKIFEQLRKAGIAPPRLYAMGFAHNNCGGFCVKAGQAHFANLLRHMPKRFEYHEHKERSLRDLLQKDVTILREQVRGVKRNMTLTQLRERINNQELFDKDEWGGCGCYSG